MLMQRYLVGDLAAGSIKPIRGDILGCDGMRRTTTSGYCSSAGLASVALTAFYRTSRRLPRRIETALTGENLEKGLRDYPTDLNNAQPCYEAGEQP